jgi:single-stranded-DNA-specific exonuclease
MKIVQKGAFNGNIINTTLENRNIPNIELFLNPEDALESNPLEIYNIKDGHDLLLTHMAQKSLIVILVDSDADGFTSGSIMFQYLDRLGVNVVYIVHDGKAHGLTNKIMEELEDLRPDLLITPDSTSNDVEQIEKLYELGIDVLVIDHHHVSEFTEKGVVINNQLCEVTNHRFVGAGMVYKFIQGLDTKLGLNYADDYLDLVAIGQIGDASDISDPEIRKLVFKGINNVKNKFLKVAIATKLGLGVKVAPKDLSFNVIPLINAVTRVGTVEEREYLFEALSGIDDEREFFVEKKKKNPTTGKFDKVTFNYDIYQYGFDIAMKVKSRQDSVVKKMVAQLEKSVVDDAGIIIAFTEDNENPGVTGLVANKLMTKFDKPALLLNTQEETYTGSGRGHEKTLKDFRKWCEDSDLVEFAQGHDNAFGISIRKDKFDAFKDYSRTIKKQEVIYEVDVLSDRPNKDQCELVDRNKSLFGGVVSEPFIGITGLTVPKKFISQKGSMLTIYSWGVSCVMFSAPQDLIEKIIDSEDTLTIDIVGYYSMNNWNGRQTPQLIIKDIEIVNNNINDEEINEDNIIF